MSNLKNKVNNALVLANAGEIVSGVVRRIAGNEISNSINGTKASKVMIHTLAQQCIVSNLKARIKASR